MSLQFIRDPSSPDPSLTPFGRRIERSIHARLYPNSDLANPINARLPRNPDVPFVEFNGWIYVSDLEIQT